MNTYARVGNEGNNVDDFTRGRIHVGSIPFACLIILDLNDMGEDNVISVLGKVLHK